MPRGQGTGTLRAAKRRMKTSTTAGHATTTTTTDSGIQKATVRKPAHYEVILWTGRFSNWCKRKGVIIEDKVKSFPGLLIEFLREDYPPVDPWAASRTSKATGDAIYQTTGTGTAERSG